MFPFDDVIMQQGANDAYLGDVPYILLMISKFPVLALPIEPRPWPESLHNFIRNQ